MPRQQPHQPVRRIADVSEADVRTLSSLLATDEVREDRRGFGAPCGFQHIFCLHTHPLAYPEDQMLSCHMAPMQRQTLVVFQSSMSSREDDLGEWTQYSMHEYKLLNLEFSCGDPSYSLFQDLSPTLVILQWYP